MKRKERGYFVFSDAAHLRKGEGLPPLAQKEEGRGKRICYTCLQAEEDGDYLHFWEQKKWNLFYLTGTLGRKRNPEPFQQGRCNTKKKRTEEEGAFKSALWEEEGVGG